MPQARDLVVAVEELDQQIGEKCPVEAVPADVLWFSVAGPPHPGGGGFEVKGCHQVLIADLNSDVPVVRHPQLYRALLGWRP